MTGRTAGTVRRGPLGIDQGGARDALRPAWGEVCDTGFADRAYRAARLDGTGYLLSGATPDELAAAVRADWTARSKR